MEMLIVELDVKLVHVMQLLFLFPKQVLFLFQKQHQKQVLFLFPKLQHQSLLQHQVDVLLANANLNGVIVELEMLIAVLDVLLVLVMFLLINVVDVPLVNAVARTAIAAQGLIIVLEVQEKEILALLMGA
jgi:hypothetical protein